MLTALQLMQMQWPAVGLRERGILERQVRHLARLVDDLLDVARVTRGHVTLRTEPLELRRAVDAACEIAAPLLEQRRHRLVVDVPAQGLPLLADPVRLAQVVGNLLTNAARFTAPGGDIRLSARATGDGEAELAVSDTGIGLTEPELTSVFELFVQGRQALHRPEGGLGLGLPIARSLAQLHGGVLRAESAGIGHGSRFVLRLPLAPAAGGGGEPAAAPGAAPGPAGQVLVVDDNPDAADALAAQLRALGYATHVAHDGPTALALAERAPLDAAVLDIGLPVMDGYELARRLRARPGGAALRLVALSGGGPAHDPQRARAHGLDEQLVKPVALPALLRALRR